jgi:hypothetical protein
MLEEVPQPRRAALEGDLKRVYMFFAPFVALGLVFVLLGGWHDHPVVAMLWAVACLACGGCVGFLFGIPRVLQQDSTARPQGSDAKTSDTSRQGLYSIRANTNLEQISDWLTKIIVGVTLIQLQKLPGELNRASLFIANSLGGANDQSFAGAIIVFFSAGGFLGGYIFTRLFLTGAFYRADQPDLPISQEEKREIAETRLDIKSGDAYLTGAAERAAAQILSKPLEQLASIDDISVWAKAQLNAKNFGNALAGYRKAVAQAPGDVNLRVEYAIALFDAKTGPDLAVAQLLEAYKRLTPQTDIKVKQNLYDTLTYVYLYVDPPEGFNGTIRYGEEYTADRHNPTDGGIYVDLAAAYGQKYRWYQQHPDPAVKLAEVRAQALSAIKAALAIDQAWLPNLRMLLDPGYQGKDPQDDDLEVFAGDPEFREVLGMTDQQ